MSSSLASASSKKSDARNLLSEVLFPVSDTKKSLIRLAWKLG
jgi:hypothetical protein